MIHSTWDYHQACDDFVGWADHVDAVSRLVNPATVVAWNSHKEYLLDLSSWGVPTVPTVVVPRSAPESVTSIADREGWTELVIKPSVAGGARGAGRWRADDPAAERALATLLAQGDVLVQPYLREIESGETSVVMFADTVSHAVVKVPATGDFRVQRHHGGAERAVEPTAAEIDLARQAVTAARRLDQVVYARVDCVTVDGRPQVMELELIEPALFLPVAPPAAADRLLEAILGSV